MSIQVIAIDGPSASGKSSTARAVAEALGYAHLDSGALYRGLTRVAIDLDPVGATDPSRIDADQVIREAERRGLMLEFDGRDYSAYLDGLPADDRLRTTEVTAAVSAVSAVPQLREWVNGRLRPLARAGQGVVVDGRDIGTVVFPDAALKIFLVASAGTRARRRLIQRGERFDRPRLEAETAILAARDAADSARAVGPLRRAGDAIPLDGTSLSFEEQVAVIIALARDRGLLPPTAPSGSTI